MDAKATQRSLALAAGTVVSLLALTGCEKLQQSTAEADRATVAALNEGKIEAAANEKGASASLRAAANSQLAAQRSQQGGAAYSQTLDQQLEVRRLGWRATHFAVVANENMEASRAIGKYEPSANIEKLDQVIGDIRGASDKMTRTLESAQGLELATITAMQANIEKINHDIAEIDKEIAALESQRAALAQQSQELAGRASEVKGQAGVDLFAQAVQAKKGAADTATKIETAQMRLLPLRQALESAELQKESLTAGIAQMDALKVEVNTGWEEIRKQAAVRMAIAESIAGKQPAPGQATLLNAVKEMEGLAADLERAYEKATTAYENAAASEAAAHTAAQDAFKRAGELATAFKGKPEEKLFKSVQALLNTSGLRMNQTTSEYATARTNADWAAVNKVRRDAISLMADVAQVVKLQVPQELNANQVGSSGAEHASKADAQLKKAASDFEMITTAPFASPETKRAAAIGRIATQLALAEVAAQSGEAGQPIAVGYREAARTAAKDLTSNTPAEVKLPAIVQDAAGR